MVARWSRGDVVRPGEETLARTLVDRGVARTRAANRLDALDVDVIIPVYGHSHHLDALVSRLAQWPITIVDDGSPDSAAIADVARRAGATLVRLESNQGPAAARNAGLCATTREFVWFLDADVELGDPAHTFARLGAYTSDPRVAGVAPRVRGTPGHRARDRFERHFGPLDLGDASALVTPSGSVSYVASACLLARRDALGHGFDPTLRVGEDVDLVWRLHDHGWLVHYDADVTVTHLARPTWRQWWSQRVGYGRSAAALATRHGSRLAPLRLDPWTGGAWLAIVAGRPQVAGHLWVSARETLARRVSDEPRGSRVASALVARATATGGADLARGAVRVYGPWLALAALVPRWRRRALTIIAVGVAWRWRRGHVDLRDVPLAALDDLAYAVGVARGARAARSWRALTPAWVGPWRDLLGLATRDR